METVVSETETDELLSDGQWLRARRLLFGQILLFATLSLIASFVLSYDALLLAGNPGVELNCSINVWIDCAKVGLTPQANLLGFPNAFLGLASMPVVVTIAVAALAGTRFPRWFMLSANVGVLLGVGFAHWLLYQSTFVIGALCPWCLLVLVSSIFMFIATTHWNILENNLYLPSAAHARAVGFVRGGWMAITLIAWLAILVVIEAIKWLPVVL